MKSRFLLRWRLFASFFLLPLFLGYNEFEVCSRRRATPVARYWKRRSFLVTNCPVDSGQLGIFDNSFFERSSRGEYDDPDSFYGECCGITLADEPYGPLMNGYGIVTGGFGGDGVYPLYVARDERSRVVAIKVDFGND